MKRGAVKNLIGVVVAAMLLASCTTHEVQYPQHLEGYWVSTPTNNNAYWYELDVNNADSAQAVLTYNKGIQVLSIEMMDIEYDPANGKGTLRTKGKHLPLQAKNDTTIIVTFAQTGETEMHLRVRPSQPESKNDMEGYWAGTYTEGNGTYTDEENVGLLIYPADMNGKAHLSVLFNGFGTGADLTMDTETHSGSINLQAGDSAYTMSFTTDYKTLVMNAEGQETTFTRQARAKEIAIDMVGTWKASMLGMNYVAVVEEDSTCTLRIQEINPKDGQNAKEITLTGKMYYCVYAGRGVLELDDKNNQEIFEGESVAGLSVMFAALSPTTVRVVIEWKGLTMSLDFTKEL